MESKTGSAQVGALLLGASLLLSGPLPGNAQGWNAEVTDVAAITQRSPSKESRATSSAKAAKAPGHAKSGKAASPLPKADPAENAAVRDGAAKADAPTAEPQEAEPSAAAAPPAPAPSDTLANAAPRPAAAIIGQAGDSEEPQDAFSDIRLLQRQLDNDVLTTQVTPGEPDQASTDQEPAAGSPASRYCSNIADAAIDARITWQRQNLAEVEKQVQQKTAELEAKTAEYQRWLARRDEFAEKAKKAVVDIYTKMKPDAAALQLAALDEETAAALIIKLDPRTASAVMNEMDPAQAARLTAIISGAAKGPVPPRRPAQAGSRS